jgi:hypothetical protein
MYWLGIAPLLCALTPCERSYSLDRWLAIRRNLPPPEEGNLWGLRLIVIQLSVMYFFSGTNKLQPDFWSGDRLEALSIALYPHAISPYTFVFAAMAWIVMVLEFALAFGLPPARTRRYLVIPGLLMHGMFYLLLPVKTYSITIILLYLAYFDANKVHKIIDQLGGVASLDTAESHGKVAIAQSAARYKTKLRQAESPGS